MEFLIAYRLIDIACYCTLTTLAISFAVSVRFTLNRYVNSKVCPGKYLRDIKFNATNIVQPLNAI